MWVDDHIFDEQWENKAHMEKASTLGIHMNVHFIPKSSTTSALEFLRSEFGQRMKRNEYFRLVTDMNRENKERQASGARTRLRKGMHKLVKGKEEEEEEARTDSYAGAWLLIEVRKLGFNQPCLVFTGNAHVAQAKINELFSNPSAMNIRVTDKTEELENFVLFK